MQLLRCRLTLHDTLFFATREMGVLYETERYIHNYALAYALFGDSLLSRPSFVNIGPRYAEELELLNEAGIYVMPARPIEWDYLLITWKIGQIDYYRKPERFGESGRNYPANYGRAKEIAPGSTFECYVLSREPVTLPHWIRLGKWMSKTLVEYTEVKIEERSAGAYSAACALNPLDVPDGTLRAFDIVSMPPSSLVANGQLDGPHYQIGHAGRGIPTNMRFTVPDVQAQPRRARGKV